MIIPDQLRQDIVSIYREWGMGEIAKGKFLALIERERKAAVEEACQRLIAWVDAGRDPALETNEEILSVVLPIDP